LLSWLVTWWFTPIDNVSDNKFDPTNFSERDIVPLGYAAFAFALGLVAITSSRITDPSGHSVSAIRITPNDPCIANHSCLAGYHQTMT
jgi:hypothetical protein